MKLLSAGLGSVLVAGFVFAAASTAISPGGLLARLNAGSTDNAYVRGDVTPISPKISGYITEVAIRDNQAVKTGDVLFRIDDSDYRARVDQASANVATRRALLETLGRQIEFQRAVVEQAGAALKAAEADAKRATREFERIHALNGHGWVSGASRDESEADHLRTVAKIAEAQASVSAALRQTDVLESQRPQLEADIAAADAALRLAEIELASTVIRSPSDGWVGERQARVGQYVRPGTLLVPVVSRDFWIVANFKETQMPDLQAGDAVTVAVDGVPDANLRGRIESLSPATGAQFALLPPDNATGNFTRIAQRVPVKIALDEGQTGLDRLRPGMSAVVIASSGSVSPAASESAGSDVSAAGTSSVR
ncbi:MULTISPECIES: HlyD family secretion protein [unclassified Sinorhizobium]|uniref:HlyD family secretion protein n=1 Tax=unclassified Sinorhizobium TaxID=2613772 RepID=UPI0024C2E953|nr:MULTISPECIES: HlyD family secretion protein [unclassified Sinorhizobium]MDK1373792.1 HlyD family secretion protein [Sinorhizobium sp. 6-70]MDK1481812.1 HlyD family secretion protein [Sinorhizobium sp. 6-117]